MKKMLFGLTLCLMLAVAGVTAVLNRGMEDLLRRWEGPSSAGAGGTRGEEPFNLSTVDCPEGYWVYDGRLFEQEAGPGEEGYQPYLLIRSHTEVYGYELLDEAAQHAFDLCYGEYFSGEVREGGKSFFHFTMPEPLTKTQWNNAKALYEAATISYSYRPFRYANGDMEVGKVNCQGSDCPCKDSRYRYHFYIGGVSRADSTLNSAYDVLCQRAEEILAQMDPELSEAGKCAYIAYYLTDHVTYFTDNYWERQTFGEITVVNTDALFITAYGALVNGEANCFGYARAFDYLAKKAGLSSLLVAAYNENDTIGHAWNMVQVDGIWYQLDATWMDTETPEPDMRWFLFEAGEPEHAYYDQQSYARYTIPLPPCAEQPYGAESASS